MSPRYNPAIYLILALATAAACWLIVARAPHASGSATRITYYTETGAVMRSGIYPFIGAAACSPDLSDVAGGEYRRFMLDGWLYQCLDTGGAVRVNHIDLYSGTWNGALWLRSIHGDYGEPIWLD